MLKVIKFELNKIKQKKNMMLYTTSPTSPLGLLKI